jgi:hypothetical protein
VPAARAGPAWPSCAIGPPERVAERERAHRSLAALASLKPTETRTLVLQAAGRSYRDIEAKTA